MPLHTIGSRTTRGWFGLTRGDLVSVLLGLAVYWMPGVSQQDAMQWIIDHVFCGSVAACSIFGVFVAHKSMEWGGMLFYNMLYAWQGSGLPGAEHIRRAKCQPDAPWAWAHPDPRVREASAALCRRSKWYIACVQGAAWSMQLFLWTSAVHIDWEAGSFKWEWLAGNPELSRADPATIPDKWTVAYQIAISLFVTETGFYAAHRLMHATRLYYWHKRHHEYRDTSVYAAYYVGVLDSILQDFIPAGFGVVYFKMHIWTMWLYTLPLVANSLRDHCGYNNARLLPWLGADPTQCLPLCTDTERTHDMHHRYSNCNYGAGYCIWDRLLGTWQCPDEDAENIARAHAKQQQEAPGAGAPLAHSPAVQPIEGEGRTADSKKEL